MLRERGRGAAIRPCDSARPRPPHEWTITRLSRLLRGCLPASGFTPKRVHIVVETIFEIVALDVHPQLIVGRQVGDFEAFSVLQKAHPDDRLHRAGAMIELFGRQQCIDYLAVYPRLL